MLVSEHYYLTKSTLQSSLNHNMTINNMFQLNILFQNTITLVSDIEVSLHVV